MTSASPIPPTPPGWYPAPEGPFERWWDGTQWTHNMRPLSNNGGTGTGPIPAARVAGWLIVAFGALAVLGAFLPWASVGVFTVNGTDGDGVLTLAMGLVAGGVGLVRAMGVDIRFWQLGVPVVALLLGALISVIGLYDAAHLASVAESASDSPFPIDVSIGGGLVLTVIGGLGLVSSSIFALVKNK